MKTLQEIKKAIKQHETELEENKKAYYDILSDKRKAAWDAFLDMPHTIQSYYESQAYSVYSTPESLLQRLKEDLKNVAEILEEPHE